MKLVKQSPLPACCQSKTSNTSCSVTLIPLSPEHWLIYKILGKVLEGSCTDKFAIVCHMSKDKSFKHKFDLILGCMVLDLIAWLWPRTWLFLNQKWSPPFSCNTFPNNLFWWLYLLYTIIPVRCPSLVMVTNLLPLLLGFLCLVGIIFYHLLCTLFCHEYLFFQGDKTKLKAPSCCGHKFSGHFLGLD